MLVLLKSYIEDDQKGTEYMIYYTKTNHIPSKIQRQVKHFKQSATTCFLFAPKKYIPLYDVDILKGFHFFSYEDITKKNIWLTINSLISPDSFLLFVRPSRYYKVSSLKVQYLQKLCSIASQRVIVDNTPFCEDIQYLYVPWSYIDRSILGYAHYYAFRENYMEKKANGQKVRAHDFKHLSKKLSSYYHIDYSSFLNKNHWVVEFPYTFSEEKKYAEKREQLFKKAKNPQPVITGLSDFVHLSHSKIENLKDVISESTGSCLVITNLAEYGKKLKKSLGKTKNQVVFKAYNSKLKQKEIQRFQNIVYAESPIVKTYNFYDIETAIHKDSCVYQIVGNSKVERYLFERIQKETEQINNFTGVLKRESLPAQNC